MWKKQFASFLPLAFALVNSAFARENLKFNHLSIEDGLSQNSVNCIAQDRAGYLWIGTQDGLNKYDGYNFKYYKNDSSNANSLGENHIYCFAFDRSGALWIGTRGRGLDRFDPLTETFAHFVHDPKAKNGIGENFVKAVLEDSGGGAVWIGTENGGLSRLDVKTETFTGYRHDDKNPGSLGSDTVRAICRDRSGLLWIGTEGGGLASLDERSGVFVSYKHDAKVAASISDDTVNCVFEDGKGRFWVGTTKGLDLFDRQAKTFKAFVNDPKDAKSLSNDNISAIFEDSKGRLWIGTDDGLDLFSVEGGSFDSYREQAGNKYSLSNSAVMSIFEDDAGTIWIGTYTGGLNKLTEKKFVHVDRDPVDRNTLPQNSVWAILQDRSGVVWLGTESEGLCRFDRDRGLYTTFKHSPKDGASISSDNIQAIFEDSKGRLWIGTADGLNLFDRSKEKFTRYKHDERNPKSLGYDDILRIIEDRNGYLWLATYTGGADRFDTGKNEFAHFLPVEGRNGISHKRIRTVYEDRKGNIWFGAENGLNRLDSATGQFTLYSYDPGNSDSLSHDRVFSICEDRKGSIWAATKNGLNKLDARTGKFRRYGEKDGLANNTVYSVIEDSGGSLWMSTNKGLSRLDPMSGTVKSFTTDDGLQSNEFNMGAYFLGPKGEMFFGGIGGFNSFFPGDIRLNKHVPPVVLSSFSKFGKVEMNETSLVRTGRMRLSYRDSFIAFEFSALDLVAPSKNLYAYKMEGFDTDWIYCGTRRYVSYSNLSGGKFVFRVKGSNNDGIWNEKGASIELDIPPPPWRTWWAYCLYVLVVLGTFLAYITVKRIQHDRETKLLKDINDAANRFVPYEYLAILGKTNILDVRLGDQVQKDMSVFFSDIRSFTSISEKLSPKENIDFINDYLSRVGPVIRKNGGFIDKYIGDAIMALFEGDADDAIDAALDSIRALAEFNEGRRGRGGDPVRIGVGINSGSLMLGTIGEHNRIDGSVISDAVNLASRVEGQTKNYGIEILITEHTYARLKDRDRFPIRPIDRIRVKGKDRAITVYEVFGALPGEATERKLAFQGKYREAFELYYSRRFREAGTLFKDGYFGGIEDDVMRLYIARCLHYLRNPPGEDWDGVTEMKSK